MNKIIAFILLLSACSPKPKDRYPRPVYNQNTKMWAVATAWGVACDGNEYWHKTQSGELTFYGVIPGTGLQSTDRAPKGWENTYPDSSTAMRVYINYVNSLRLARQADSAKLSQWHIQFNKEHDYN